MAKHIHAELMMQYAQDAMETGTPWDRWQFMSPHDTVWIDATSYLTFNEIVKYRRKPKTININGFEVPEPVRAELEHGAYYHYPAFNFDDPMSQSSYWLNDEIDNTRLKNGVIHLDEESAKIHAQALLSFTKQSD